MRNFHRRYSDWQAHCIVTVKIPHIPLCFLDKISGLQSTVEQKEADAVISVARLREQLELSENKSQQLQNELDSALSTQEDEVLREQDSLRKHNEGMHQELSAVVELGNSDMH